MIVLGLLLGLGCVTPYQRTGFTGGYDDTKVREAEHFIEVRGNAFTSKTTLVNYFHRRARELCAQEGFDDYSYSATTEAEVGRTGSTYTANSRTTAYGGVARSSTTIRENPGITYTKYGVSGIVVCTQRRVPVRQPPSLTPTDQTVVPTFSPRTNTDP
jgi:hypothetical protein